MNPNKTDTMPKNKENENGIIEIPIMSKNSEWIDIGGKRKRITKRNFDLVRKRWDSV